MIRPCDVFGQCTNTLGGYYCACDAGYEGDGESCRDIDECKVPALAAKCVENAECCNLPAHYVCKCKEGFVGDGFVECRDVDECLSNVACGSNALCANTVGNFTCECQKGFAGDPYSGVSRQSVLIIRQRHHHHHHPFQCADIDECRSNPCGQGSKCTNLIGDYQCSCPAGLIGDPYSRAGCVRGNPTIVTRERTHARTL